jgi:hypothetical protein
VFALCGRYKKNFIIEFIKNGSKEEERASMKKPIFLQHLFIISRHRKKKYFYFYFALLFCRPNSNSFSAAVPVFKFKFAQT